MRVNLKIARSTWILMAASFASWCAGGTRMSGWSQLAVLASVLAALVGIVVLLVSGVWKWRERLVGNLLSCLLILASVPIGQSCGATLRSAIFAYQLDRWNAAAQWVQSTYLPNIHQPIALPEQYADLAHAVFYEHDETCGPRIDFVWGVAFPVKHVIRRYALDPHAIDIPRCREGYYRWRRLADKWYELAD